MWGKELYFDATKVEANASLGSMGPRLVAVEDLLEEHLAGIFPEEVRSVGDGEDAPQIAAVVGPTGQEGQALSETNARLHRWIEEAGRQQREVVRWGYRRLADLQVSATDPDASPMHYKKKGASRLGYLTLYYVVDGGKARIILEVLVTSCGGQREPPHAQAVLFRSRFRWRLRPRSVTGDAAYGTTENIATIEKAGIRAYTALPNHEKRSSSLFLARTPSLTTLKKTPTLVPRARSWAGRVTTTRRDPSGTLQAPPPATHAPSKVGVRRARKDAG